MKKLFPIALIAVFGALSMVSCKKSSSSSSCTCHFPSAFTGKDTSYVFPNTAGTTCAQENTAIKSVYPTGGCQ